MKNLYLGSHILLQLLSNKITTTEARSILYLVFICNFHSFILLTFEIVQYVMGEY